MPIVSHCTKPRPRHASKPTTSFCFKPTPYPHHAPPLQQVLRATQEQLELPTLAGRVQPKLHQLDAHLHAPVGGPPPRPSLIQLASQPPFEGLGPGHYFLPPLETISVPPQAALLTVAPRAPTSPRPPKSASAKAKAKTRPEHIVVPPNPAAVRAVLTAHTPMSVPPPISAVARGSGAGYGHGYGYGGAADARAPGTPETAGYVDPELLVGLPRALGLRAFPTRVERG
ncbi:hypothetical protein B0H10DRAFT_2226239 [Mycena sp. CBHHK59/15]|nr:hypothetical protein B0H10DRAFT_2226239 [Mycena sp. CBHHK59/15]